MNECFEQQLALELDGLVRHRELYVPLRNSQMLLEQCKSNGYAVIGLDLCLFRPDGTTQATFTIYDGSYRESSPACWEEFSNSRYDGARRFIASIKSDPEAYFAVTLMSKVDFEALLRSLDKHSPRGHK
jgi:hypothetical protein